MNASLDRRAVCEIVQHLAKAIGRNSGYLPGGNARSVVPVKPGPRHVVANKCNGRLTEKERPLKVDVGLGIVAGSERTIHGFQRAGDADNSNQNIDLLAFGNQVLKDNADLLLEVISQYLVAQS